MLHCHLLLSISDEISRRTLSMVLEFDHPIKWYSDRELIPFLPSMSYGAELVHHQHPYSSSNALNSTIECILGIREPVGVQK